MSKLLDCVIQQVNWIGDIGNRPTGIFVFFDECREDIELVAIFRADSSSPKPFDFRNGGGVIVVIPDRANFHQVFLQNSETLNASTRSSACVPINLINAIRLTKSKATIIRKLPPTTSNLTRSPFSIFAFGAARRTSSIEFQLEALTNVLQRWSDTFVSGCRSE